MQSTAQAIATTPGLTPARPSGRSPRWRSHCASQPREVAWNRFMIGLAGLHGALLVCFPVFPLIAVGLWWNANTISHNFIHQRFFRSRAGSTAFSLYLSLLLGFPQTLWKQRHLAHHADRRAEIRFDRKLCFELLAVASLWLGMAWLATPFLLQVYLPAFLVGQGLCALQGAYEHRPATTSHYGRLYNLLFFNDGYHVEHHRRPAAHWRRLPELRREGERCSAWPAVLRWMEVDLLDWLEHLVLHSGLLQRMVSCPHERALRELLVRLPEVKRVLIVGGGLFPRTALILERLLAGSELVIIDQSRRNLTRARRFLGDRATYRQAWYAPEEGRDFDLVVVPLAYRGDRERLYRDPEATALLIHDWIWKSGEGAIVSPFLLKRINLIRARD